MEILHHGETDAVTGSCHTSCAILVDCGLFQGDDARGRGLEIDSPVVHVPALLLEAPRPPYRADTLILESTYGDRDHPDRRDRRNRLRKTLEHAVADGGTVVIPAFSIGRTQKLL